MEPIYKLLDDEQFNKKSNLPRDKSQYISLDGLYDTIVSVSPILMLVTLQIENNWSTLINER